MSERQEEEGREDIYVDLRVKVSQTYQFVQSYAQVPGSKPNLTQWDCLLSRPA